VSSEWRSSSLRRNGQPHSCWIDSEHSDRVSFLALLEFQLILSCSNAGWAWKGYVDSVSIYPGMVAAATDVTNDYNCEETATLFLLTFRLHCSRGFDPQVLHCMSQRQLPQLRHMFRHVKPLMSALFMLLCQSMFVCYATLHHLLQQHCMLVLSKWLVCELNKPMLL